MSKSQSTASRRAYLQLARLVAEGLPEPPSQNFYKSTTSQTVYLGFDERLSDALAWVNALSATTGESRILGTGTREERAWVVNDWCGHTLTIIALVRVPTPTTRVKRNAEATAIISDALATLDSAEPERAVTR